MPEESGSGGDVNRIGKIYMIVSTLLVFAFVLLDSTIGLKLRGYTYSKGFITDIYRSENNRIVVDYILIKEDKSFSGIQRRKIDTSKYTCNLKPGETDSAYYENTWWDGIHGIRYSFVEKKQIPKRGISVISISTIDSLYNNLQKKKANLKTKVICNTTNFKDTTVYYFEDIDSLLFVSSTMSKLRSRSEVYLREELLYEKGKLLYVNTKNCIIYKDRHANVYKITMKRILEFFLDKNGNCIRTYKPFEVEGEDKNDLLKKLETRKEEDDIKYFPYDGNYGDRYIEKLRKHYSSTK